MKSLTQVFVIAIIGCMCASHAVSSVKNSADPEGTIYLRDFLKLEPRGSVSVRPMQGRWQLKSLGTEKVLYSDGSWEVRDVTYPLDLKGWYDIYVSLVNGPSGIDPADWQGIHVKLTSDQWYTHILGGKNGLDYEWGGSVPTEIFWKRANLTNEDIIIYQPYGRFFKPAAGIAYIKLVPKTEKQVTKDKKRFEKAIQLAGPKSVGGMNDFWSWVFMTQGIHEEDTRRTIDNHKNAGFDTVYFQINGDGVVQYHSKVAQWVYYDPQDEPRPEGKAPADILKDHDPVKVASEHAHEIGLKFFPWFRVTNEQHPYSDLIEYSKKFRNHRMVGTDGVQTMWPSLAHPEVRDYKLAILEELVTKYQVDGLLIDYLRTLPVIGYEPPVIEAYVKKYGVDPLKVSGERSSMRWKKFRAEYVTTFMRDLKKIVDAEEKKTGRQIEIAARVTPEDNLWKGMDVETWIKEGLIDIVVVSNYSTFNPVVSIKPFKQMAKGTKCKVYACINPFFAGGSDYWAVSPDRHQKEVAEIIAKRMSQGPSNLEYSTRALEHYAEGADGVVFYESESLTAQPAIYPGKPGQLPMFRKMSNPKELLDYMKSLEVSEKAK